MPDTRIDSPGSPSPPDVAVLLSTHHFSRGLLPRIFALALVFSIELILISVWLDDAALAGSSGLAGIAHDWGAWILRGVVGFAALFGTFAWLRNKSALEQLSADLIGTPISWKMAIGHLVAMAIFAALSSSIYSGRFSGAGSNALVACWLVAGSMAIALAGLAAMPAFAWRRLFGTDRYLWVWAVLAILFACVAGNQTRTLWEPTTRLTFDLSKAFLRPFVTVSVADSARMTLGTRRFYVEIAPECSGFEGAGLITAFGIVWLIAFRKVCRWPQALLLIPAGVAILFVLNAARIAALILIGNSGAERIAEGGFHSQAGWIAFNFVALGFSVAARELPWFTAPKPAPVRAGPARNPVVPWVLPFVAILAAGMVSSALTGDFEWLYPLRFVAAAAALWYCRQSYRKLDWRFGWEAPAIGALVFAFWVAKDVFHASAGAGMPLALASSPPGLRTAWLLVRVIGAVVTVPVAEELAFRGFLLRRLVSADFESVPLDRLSWLALLISSFLFGLLHGGRWIAGTSAGILYGLALIRRGRIGEAVVAHATTNALLAIYVLTFNQWQLW